MKPVDSNQRVKRPAIRGVIRRLAVLITLITLLTSVISTQSDFVSDIKTNEHSTTGDGWLSAVAAQEEVPSINLSAEEQAWLEEDHTIRVRFAPFPPYFVLSEGEPAGVTIDYLNLIAKRTGVTFQFVPETRPWPDSLESLQAFQGPDLLANMTRTAARESYMNFSEPYSVSPRVIFTQTDAEFVATMDDLAGRALAVPRGTVVHKQIEAEYPDIELLVFDSDEDSLEAVATGEADAYIGNLTVASYFVLQRGFTNLQVAAPSPLSDHVFTFGIRRDWPELVSIINKGLDTISNEEQLTIRSKYVSVKYEHIDYGLLGMILLGSSLLLSIILYWNRRMAKEVRNRKLAEQAAREARDVAEAANQAKSVFLANMSHELRTPLNAILGFARLMVRDPGLNVQQQEMLDIINRSGEHLLGMVDDILSLSKIEAGRVELREEPFDIAQMLQDIGRIFKSRAEGKGLRFALELDTELPPYLQGDAGKLRQVLINLLSNAVKFTQAGNVWLRARSQPVADDRAMVMLQLEVEDSGPGISQDKLDEVFETFVQLDHAPNAERGTGLGLAISKSLVDVMDGAIVAKSEPGRGSLFKVNIPLQLAEAGTVTPSEAPVAEVIGLQAGQPEWRILVVDDNHENRLLLTNLLAQAGFAVREAENGEAALAMFQAWRPHFIWMDMRMPVLDGYAATQKIRALPGGEAVKIVAVTASVLEEQREEILASGCDDVVRKPFREHEIFEAMARHLGVKYRTKEGEAAPAQMYGVDLTAAMLAELPPELLQELRQTTLALDGEASLAVIERIEEHAPDTATGLRALMQDLKMGRIRELLRETER